MKIPISLLLFLLSFSCCFAQPPHSKFVENKKVQFAILFTDTFRFSNPNLSFMLREKFDKAEIKASIPQESNNPSNVVFASREEVINRILEACEGKTAEQIADEIRASTHGAVIEDPDALAAYFVMLRDG